MPIPQEEKYVPGELIRMLRNIKGLKQDIAAKRLGICQQAISKLERSKKVSYKNFLSIAAALKCTDKEIERVKEFLPPPLTHTYTR